IRCRCLACPCRTRTWMASCSTSKRPRRLRTRRTPRLTTAEPPTNSSVTELAEAPVSSERRLLSAENTWVLICTYNRNELLDELLGSLAHIYIHVSSGLPHVQTVVVDNAEQRRAADLVRHRLP